MANFKAPIAPIFNGEQFELVNGNVINAIEKPVFEFTATVNGNSMTYDKPLEDIIAAKEAEQEIMGYLTCDGYRVLADKTVVDIWDDNTGEIYLEARLMATNIGPDEGGNEYEINGQFVLLQATDDYYLDTGDHEYYFNPTPLDKACGTALKYEGTGADRKFADLSKAQWATMQLYFNNDNTIPFVEINEDSGFESAVDEFTYCRLYYVSKKDDSTEYYFVGDAYQNNDTERRGRYKCTIAPIADDKASVALEKLPEPGSFNIVFTYDTTAEKYACNHNLAEIVEAVNKELDVNVKFNYADGKVSYDQWGVDEIKAAVAPDKGAVVFKNGYYRNDEDYERCFIEESIEFDADYAKDAKTLELVEKVVYSRDYKIKYACGELPAGAATPVGKFPAPKFASEVADGDTDPHPGEYYGKFEIVAEDLVAPTATVAGLAFKGWFYDKGCTAVCEVGDSVTKDVRLYAKFGTDTVNYTVQFRATGETSLTDYDLARTSNAGEAVSFDCRTPGNPMGMEIITAGEVAWGLTIMDEGLDTSRSEQKPLKVNGSEISEFTYTPENGDVITVEAYFFGS